MLRVRPYTTFLDLPRGANIFWIALTGLTYETLDTKQQRKYKASSLRSLGRYTDDSLRITVPRIFKHLSDYYIKYSKVFQRRLSVNQLRTNINNLNADGALVRFENGNLGFINMLPYPVIYFTDLSIKNINQIKTWYTTEIVYFTSIDSVMRKSISVKVLDNFSVTHEITITGKGDYDCDICTKNCIGIQYLTELIENHGYIPDDDAVLVKNMRKDIPVPTAKLWKFLTPVSKTIPDRKIITPKEPDSNKQSDYLSGLSEILDVDDETIMDLMDEGELGRYIEQETGFNYPKDGCTGDMDEFDEIVEVIKIETEDEFINFEATDIMCLTDIPLLHKDESAGIFDLKSMREYSKVDNELISVARALELIHLDPEPEHNKLINVLEMESSDLTDLTIYMTGLRIANTLEVDNIDQFVEEFKSYMYNLDLTEIIDLIVSAAGGYNIIQKQVDKFMANTSLYLAVGPETFANLYINDDPIENINIVDGVQPGYNLQRLAIESNKMHIPLEDYSGLPKYGFLSTKNFVRPGKASSYGRIILEFNDSVRDQSSACIKDSFDAFNPDFQLSKKSENGGDISNLILGIVSLEHPDFLFFNTEDVSDFAKKVICNIMSLVNFLGRLRQDPSYGMDLQYLLGANAEHYSYFEAHIPGIISLDDVKCIYVTNEYVNRMYHLLNNVERANQDIPIKLYKSSGILVHGETPDLKERVGKLY